MITRLLTLFTVFFWTLSVCAENDSPQTSTALEYASSIFSELMDKAKISKIAPLKGGASGTGLFKVSSGNHSYVLRILSKDESLKFIKRELNIWTRMGEMGVSPMVYAASPEKRALVMAEVQGGPLWGPNLSSDEISQLGQKLNIMHQPHSIDMIRRTTPRQIVENILKNSDSPLPQIYREALEELTPYFDALEKEEYFLTHTDLNPGNILKGKEGIKIIDWEDASLTHPYLDLASILTFYDLNPKQVAYFLTQYTNNKSQKVRKDELKAAYKVYNFIVSIRLLRTSERLESKEESPHNDKVEFIRNQFKKKEWSKIIPQLNDKAEVYALSLLFLEQSKKDY